jgi:hypothetical protein
LTTRLATTPGGPGCFDPTLVAWNDLEAIANPKHKQPDELREWGGNFDPERFDVADANAALRCSRTERLTRRAMRRA